MVVRVAHGFENLQAAAGNILFERRRIADGGENHDFLAPQLLQVDGVDLDALVPVGNFHEIHGVVDTFHDGRARVEQTHVFHQGFSGQLRALVAFGEEEHIRPVQMPQRFAQDAPRKEAAVAEQVQRVDEDDVQVPGQLPVLVPVVHQDDVGLQFSTA